MAAERRQPSGESASPVRPEILRPAATAWQHNGYPKIKAQQSSRMIRKPEPLTQTSFRPFRYVLRTSANHPRPSLSTLQTSADAVHGIAENPSMADSRQPPPRNVVPTANAKLAPPGGCVDSPFCGGPVSAMLPPAITRGPGFMDDAGTPRGEHLNKLAFLENPSHGWQWTPETPRGFSR
jgi:hypothetical protein